MQVNVKLLTENAKLPEYATSGAACFDIAAVAGAVIQPGGAEIFDTGLAFEVPDGHVMLVFSRSGHGFKNGVRLCNAVGVIDSDYRGPLCVKLHNDSDTATRIEDGDRIAQALIIPVFTVGFNRVTELSDTARGAGGFGSTGTATRTNADLKVGQRVRLSPDHNYPKGPWNPTDTEGVVELCNSKQVRVAWGNGYKIWYRATYSDLIPQ